MLSWSGKLGHSGVTAEINDEFATIVSLGLSNISHAIFTFPDENEEK